MGILIGENSISLDNKLIRIRAGDGLLMKKRYLCVLLIASITLAGCQKTSKEFLTYEDTVAATDQSINNRITEGDFSAKNITVVSDKDNIGGDELLTSGSTLLINVTDNKVIYADRVYDRMYPASLTKLLTAFVVCQNGELTDAVTVSSNATQIADIGAKVCGFEDGDVISLEALLNSMLIHSGNDAAIAIAEHVGQSEEGFVQMMNKEAQKIGAVQSNFVNSHGLHDNSQYSTAYDIYLILNELLSFDTFRNMINTNSYTVVYKNEDGNDQEKTLNTTNSYLSNEAEAVPGITVIGGLSGSTNKAGSCLVLLCKDNMGKEYISLILDATDKDTLYTQMNHLLSLALAQ